MGLVIFLVVLGLLVAVAVMAYNRLVALGQRSAEAWSDVEVQLKRRTDLVRDLNTAVDSFPANQIALVFRFVKRGYFELDRPEDRQVPKVSFPGRA
jgi:hypothetical protein